MLHTKQFVVSDKSVISGSPEVSDDISHLVKFLNLYTINPVYSLVHS
ncbi:hypothetical protein Xentx_02647 [Xenorhabdus thuongxuanensis]|uniref:Uncharacterized protein n=1 Tax=Xenorhabdus thuongxuanensis TaxID=1873484 RepID=A0A1Q5TX01_9GAMM|nr:hypothetical protein Xentx_02647 [Xenorhabdus thuongxuanensis]